MTLMRDMERGYGSINSRLRTLGLKRVRKETVSIAVDELSRVKGENMRLKDQVSALKAELAHINRMTVMDRVFGWPWDKNLKQIKLVRRG